MIMTATTARIPMAVMVVGIMVICCTAATATAIFSVYMTMFVIMEIMAVTAMMGRFICRASAPHTNLYSLIVETQFHFQATIYSH
jgi:hypothetical protein